jgi:septal ring factor EnvC (AmiA/AmiB activator)
VRRAALALLVAAMPVSAAQSDGAPEPAGAVPPAVALATAEAAQAISAARARLAETDAAWSGDGAGAAAHAGALREAEVALAGLRAGIAATEREAAAMRDALALDAAATRRLLAALVTRGRAAEGTLALHPGGPDAAARAAMMIGGAEAVLAAEAAVLRERLAASAAVERLRDEGVATLADASQAVEAARDRLYARVAAAGPGAPPPPDSAAARLVAESATLTDLAARLAGAPAAPVGAARLSARNAPEDAAVPLRLAPPVAGSLLRGFAEPDAAGERRPGLTFEAPARALVIAPAAGRVAYVGPFLDYGTVAVIEVAPGTMVVLAGLAVTAVAEGDMVADGAPVGFLGGLVGAPQDYVKPASHGTGASAGGTLYMEVWRRTEPVDPGPLLVAGRN